MSENESSSFRQCCSILNRYDITIISPDGLDISCYTKVLNEYNTTFFHIEFDKSAFLNIEGYNKLMLDKNFYDKFKQYEYILIHQLDAYVFEDKLEYWCKQGFDYIGAPWFFKLWRFKHTKRLTSVGNGGFSLRRVEACLNVLNHKGQFKEKALSLFALKNSIFLKLLKLPFNRLISIGFRNINTVPFFVSINSKTEDMFWGIDTRDTLVDFKVAPVEKGIEFAFECNPEFLFEKNDNKLPFGCHAYMKYEPKFWAKYIKLKL